MVQDLRVAIRSLLKRPSFSALAILTLALGIGATTTIFSIVNAVIVRPLPYSDPERLVMVFENSISGNPKNVVAPANFLAWQDEAESYEYLAAFGNSPVHLTGVENPEELSALRVSASYFPALGMGAVLGRTFTQEEDRPGGERVAILSDRLWNRRFGGDTKIIGKRIELNQIPHTVVGVMPSDFHNVSMEFRIAGRAELWLPIAFDESARSWGGRYLHVIGLLDPGVPFDRAQSEMNTIATRLEQAFPDRNKGWGVNVVPLHEHTVGGIRPALVVLFGAVALVLLIGCVNVANLLLTRGAERQREIAIRSSLGASRARVLRQLLIESLLLAGAGGVLGLALGYMGAELLLPLLPQDISLPRRGEIHIDGWVAAFAFGVSLLSGMVFGLVPAWGASKTHLVENLKEGGARTSAGLHGHRFRGSLVAIEMALALVLLTGAGLLIKSLSNLSRVNPGITTENVVTARIVLPSSRYPEHQKIAFFDRLFERLEALPGAGAIGGITWLPLSGMRSATSFWRGDQPEPPPDEQPTTDIRIISPTYFQTMGIPLLQGRLFDKRDRSDAPQVIIVNKTLADQFYPDEDPLGKQLVYSWGEPVVGEIVGIVGNVLHGGVDQESRPAVYRPYAQEQTGLLHVVVRTSSDPQQMVAPLARELHALDPDLPLASVRTLDEMLSSSVSTRRIQTTVLSLFAAAALLLAAIGIYGVISYSVSQRLQEMGIRMALGAQGSDVLKLVIQQGMGFTLLGALVGTVVALAASRLFTSLVFGVSTTDPAIYLSTLVFLIGIALVACWIPAKRATKIDPIVALRYE